MADPRWSYAEAHALTLAHIQPLPAEEVELMALVGRVLAQDLVARVDSPSADVSFKDGYAVISADIAQATPESPVRLRLLDGRAAAGGGLWQGEITPGTAIRILSGGEIPRGAQAVVAEEFTHEDGDSVLVTADAQPGRNVLPRGCDIAAGTRLFPAATRLRPTQIGMMAAAGLDRAPVVRRPRVALIATGDEVIAPGKPLQPGKLYASNLVTLAAWCGRYDLAATTDVVPDHAPDIRAALAAAVATHDAVITSGGAWKGERDLVAGLLDDLGWTMHYHRVRIGPGKAVGFGLLAAKPVFCLPGGPPSNHIAFLQLALPGLLRLAGVEPPGLPTALVELAADLRGQEDWTQFEHGRLEAVGDGLRFHPLKPRSRLQMMAEADAVVMIPEGVAHIPAGEVVRAQLLR
ncbi:MAG: molybdopterin molybdotransferase MoeA [Anaerolineae bacterium]|nr:molybdopterin molybdotransferase MoeA [Anaerolineae bacterium]